MQLQLLPGSLAAVTAWGQLAAARDSMHNMTLVEESDLRQDIADSFLACLNATNSTYRLYVDHGTTVVYTPNNRRIDFCGVDEGLLKCLTTMSDTIMVATQMQRGHESDHKYFLSIPATDVASAWLIDQGARGLNESIVPRDWDRDDDEDAWNEDEAEGNLIEERSIGVCTPTLTQ